MESGFSARPSTGPQTGSVREAVAADAPALAEVLATAWRAAYMGIIDADFLAGMSIRETTDRWESILRENTQVPPRVAVLDGAVVGFCQFGVLRDPPPGPRPRHSLHRGTVCVERVARKMGMRVGIAAAWRGPRGIAPARIPKGLSVGCRRKPAGHRPVRASWLAHHRHHKERRGDSPRRCSNTTWPSSWAEPRSSGVAFRPGSVSPND